MHPSVVRRAFVAAAGTAALALGVTVPAHAAGNTVPIKKLGTVNVREAAANARKATYRPEAAQLPRPSSSTRSRSGASARRPAAARAPRGPQAADRRRAPVTSAEVQRGFEGQDITDTVFSQGFELEPPDQGLCGGRSSGTTFLWETVNLAPASTTRRATSTRRRRSA